jgi:integrase
MRRGELLGLKWEDVDLEGSRIHVAGGSREPPSDGDITSSMRHHVTAGNVPDD